MSVKIVSYGGRIGWFLRTHISKFTSIAYLESQYLVRKRLFKKYIEWFENKDILEQPCLISIETINRCNGKCDFCPANRNAESRPFKRMDDDLFEKIIRELREWDYSGFLNLYVNNEPLMDKQIEEKYRYAKKMLPKAKMLLYTNGTLLSKDRFMNLAAIIDKMIINNYSEKLELHRNIREIYKFAKNDEFFKDRDITIQIRYVHEILTNRSGSAPNKRKAKEHHKVCILPYTDITIFPDGTCGLCCNDALEKTKIGDVSINKLQDIWNSQRYRILREIIGEDREGYFFCKGCDFVDAGIRNTFMKAKLKHKKT